MITPTHHAQMYAVAGGGHPVTPRRHAFVRPDQTYASNPVCCQIMHWRLLPADRQLGRGFGSGRLSSHQAGAEISRRPHFHCKPLEPIRQDSPEQLHPLCLSNPTSSAGSKDASNGDRELGKIIRERGSIKKCAARND